MSEFIAFTKPDGLRVAVRVDDISAVEEHRPVPKVGGARLAAKGDPEVFITTLDEPIRVAEGLEEVLSKIEAAFAEEDAEEDIDTEDSE